MSNHAVHINKNYGVYINADATGYQVINLTTKVVEFEAISLPECIFGAENLNVVIEFGTWEWVGKRAVQQQAEDKAAAAKADNALSFVN